MYVTKIALRLDKPEVRTVGFASDISGGLMTNRSMLWHTLGPSWRPNQEVIATIYPALKKKHNPDAAAGTDFCSKIEIKYSLSGSKVLKKPVARRLYLISLRAQPRRAGLLDSRQDLQATPTSKQIDRRMQTRAYSGDSLTPGSGLL